MRIWYVPAKQVNVYIQFVVNSLLIVCVQERCQRILIGQTQLLECRFLNVQKQSLLLLVFSSIEKHPPCVFGWLSIIYICYVIEWGKKLLLLFSDLAIIWWQKQSPKPNIKHDDVEHSPGWHDNACNHMHQEACIAWQSRMPAAANQIPLGWAGKTKREN